MQVIVIALHGPLCSNEVLDSAKSNLAQLPCFDETTDIIRVLLRSYNVGIWSSECPGRLMEAVELLLPPDILSQILFVCASNNSRRPSFFRLVNMFKKASINRRSVQYLWPKCVVVADLDPFKNPTKAIVHYLTHHFHETGRVAGLCKALRLEEFY